MRSGALQKKQVSTLRASAIHRRYASCSTAATPTAGANASSGSAGMAFTPATGAQPTASTSGAAAATGQQVASPAQVVTQPVSATQVTGDQEDEETEATEATDVTVRTASSPLATTADSSLAPGLIACAGATTLGAATLGRIWRSRRKTR